MDFLANPSFLRLAYVKYIFYLATSKLIKAAPWKMSFW